MENAFCKRARSISAAKAVRRRSTFPRSARDRRAEEARAGTKGSRVADRADRRGHPENRIAAGAERERAECCVGETRRRKETDPRQTKRCASGGRCLRSRVGRRRTPAPGERRERPRAFEKALRITGASSPA